VLEDVLEQVVRGAIHKTLKQVDELQIEILAIVEG
jgi:hypothetical protein